MHISATLALEADDDVLVDRLINRGKPVVGQTIRMKKNQESIRRVQQ